MKNKDMQKRKTGKEQFYTPQEVARVCTDIMFRILGEDAAGKKWLEPAGGTGVFIQELQNRGVQDITSYDIEPKHPLVQLTSDFLKEDISHLKGCAVITNPPFGRMHQLCVPFFNKCAEEAEFIGFLVPKSWRKWTISNRLSLDFHLILDQDFKMNFVNEDGTELQGNGINVCFQVWQRKNVKRQKVKIEDRGYLVRCDRLQSEVGITMFGWGCGKLRDPSDAKTGTYYFKTTQPWVLHALRQLDFKPFMENSVMIPALSMLELNFLLNEWADKNLHV